MRSLQTAILASDGPRPSIISFRCHICHLDKEEALTSPCHCKGMAMALVHKSCFDRWLVDSNISECGSCNVQFYPQPPVTQLFLKYT